MSVQISSIKLTQECDYVITVWDLVRNVITGSGMIVCVLQLNRNVDCLIAFVHLKSVTGWNLFAHHNAAQNATKEKAKTKKTFMHTCHLCTCDSNTLVDTTLSGYVCFGQQVG